MMQSGSAEEPTRPRSVDVQLASESPFPPIVPKYAFSETPMASSITLDTSANTIGNFPVRPSIARPSEVLMSSPRPKAPSSDNAGVATDAIVPESQRQEKKKKRKQGNRRQTQIEEIMSPTQSIQRAAAGRRQSTIAKNLDTSSIEERLVDYSDKRSYFPELGPNEKLVQGISKSLARERTTSPAARRTASPTARAEQSLMQSQVQSQQVRPPEQQRADKRVIAAWVIKYYIELFRHRVNRQAFMNLKESFNSKFALVTRYVHPLPSIAYSFLL